jgi:hypothetical protein
MTHNALAFRTAYALERVHAVIDAAASNAHAEREAAYRRALEGIPGISRYERALDAARWANHAARTHQNEWAGQILHLC